MAAPCLRVPSPLPTSPILEPSKSSFRGKEVFMAGQGAHPLVCLLPSLPHNVALPCSYLHSPTTFLPGPLPVPAPDPRLSLSFIFIHLSFCTGHRFLQQKVRAHRVPGRPYATSAAVPQDPLMLGQGTSVTGPSLEQPEPCGVPSDGEERHFPGHRCWRDRMVSVTKTGLPLFQV